MSIKRAVERYVGGGYKAEQMSALFWGSVKEIEELKAAQKIAQNEWEGWFQERDDRREIEMDDLYQERFVEGEKRGIMRAKVFARNEFKKEGALEGFFQGITTADKPFKIYDLSDPTRGVKPYTEAAKLEDLNDMLPDSDNYEQRRFRAFRTFTGVGSQRKQLAIAKKLETNPFLYAEGGDLIGVNTNLLFNKTDPLETQLKASLTGFNYNIWEDRRDRDKINNENKIQEAYRRLNEAQAEGDQIWCRYKPLQDLLKGQKERNEEIAKADLNKVWIEHSKMAREVEKRKTAEEDIKKLEEEKKEIEARTQGQGEGGKTNKIEKSMQEVTDLILEKPKVIDVQPTPKERAPKRRKSENRRVVEVEGEESEPRAIDKFDLLDAGFPAHLADNQDFVKAVNSTCPTNYMRRQIKEKGTSINRAVINAGLKLNKNPGLRKFDKLLEAFGEEHKQKEPASEAPPKKSVGQTK